MYFYNTLAQYLTQGILKGGCTFPLLYPLFLSIIYRIFSVNYLVVRIIQVIIGCFSCILLYKICNLILNKKAAIISAVILALYFPLIVYSGTLFTENQYIFLLFLSIYFLLLFYHRNKAVYLILAGLFSGLTLLTRGTAAGLIAGMILWLVIRFKNNMADLVKIITIFVLTIIVVISPVTVRNYLITNKFILISANDTWNLARGTGPVRDFWGPVTDDKVAQWYFFDKGINVVRQFYYDQAVNNLKKDPLIFFKLLPQKMWGYFFRNYYHIFVWEYKTIFYLFRATQLFFICLLLPSFFVSFIVIPKDIRSNLSLLYILIIFNILFYSFFFGTSRFRLPTDPFFIIIFVATCLELAAKYKLARQKQRMRSH
jgi:4-amino-4-deoxy-L-arabinose transferase-like glycosyltransferase